MKTKIIAFVCLLAASAVHSHAQSPQQLRSIQRTANTVSATATQLDAMAARLFTARAVDVVPDGIYRFFGAGLDILVADLKQLQAKALATGQKGLIEEAQGLLKLAANLPKGNEISEVVLRVAEGGGEISEVILMQETLAALRAAAPCIRREIQEID